MLEADYAAQAAAKKTKAFFEQIERRKNLKLVKMPYEILSRIVQHCADDRTNAKKVLAGKSRYPDVLRETWEEDARFGLTALH